jgi:hypothetical protein
MRKPKHACAHSVVCRVLRGQLLTASTTPTPTKFPSITNCFCNNMMVIHSLLSLILLADVQGFISDYIIMFRFQHFCESISPIRSFRRDIKNEFSLYKSVDGNTLIDPQRRMIRALIYCLHSTHPSIAT